LRIADVLEGLLCLALLPFALGFRIRVELKFRNGLKMLYFFIFIPIYFFFDLAVLVTQFQTFNQHTSKPLKTYKREIGSQTLMLLVKLAIFPYFWIQKLEELGFKVFY